MTDVYKEGYVGVTTKPLKQRLNEHAKYAKRSSVVAKAIVKYDDIEIVELFRGSKEECLTLENNYRPEPKIGWNLVEGGGIPPKNVKGGESSKKISLTLKNKGISPYSEKTHSPEAIEKRKASMKGRKWFYDPITFESKLTRLAPNGWMQGRPSR
jgi:hypothetical protein